MPRPSAFGIPAEAARRLAPYVDDASLRSAVVRTGRPWRWLPRLLRCDAVTLGRSIAYRPEAYDDVSGRGLALLAHECTHVRQYRERGAPRFVARYLVEAMRHGFAHDRHPLEQEPLAVQRRVRADLG
jgi:hypothetical protein